MPRLTPHRAVWVAALAAVVVYLAALRNDWALDDHGVIERNPAAHSIGAALRAAFSPYWPPEGEFTAGLYRPVTTLSYAVDWTISGGRPWWFHLTNLLLHALATALVVLLALRWLSPAGALAAGLLFATHAVHVEAVANVVGRAEILAAIGLLAAVLAARRYRRLSTPHGAEGAGVAGGAEVAFAKFSAAAASAAPSASSAVGWRVVWLAAVLLAVAFALGSKEHAVVALFLIALDQALEKPALRRVGWNLYVAVGAVTVAWLFLWRAIAGAFVGAGAVVPLRELSVGARLATVVPVQLDVVRLLAWPARLAADYSPQTVPMRPAWTPVATLAAIVVAALLALACLVWRRAPVVTFGILAGAASYLPTSNLLFTSGVVLAERTLYFAALAPALTVGWLVTRAGMTRYRGPVLAATALASLALGARSIARIPFWRDSRTVVVDGFVEHPENFSNQIRLADALLQTGDSGRALAHYLVALELYDGYSFVPARAGQLALGLGRRRLALDLGRRAYAISPGHPGATEFLADVFLALHQPDSALVVASEAMGRNPYNLRVLETYRRTLARTGAPRWATQLTQARIRWLEGRLVSASATVDSARLDPATPPKPGECQAIVQAIPMLRILAPGRVGEARAVAAHCHDTVSTVVR